MLLKTSNGPANSDEMEWMELPNRLTRLVNLRKSSARGLGAVDNVLFRGLQNMGWGFIEENSTDISRNDDTAKYRPGLPSRKDLAGSVAQVVHE